MIEFLAKWVAAAFLLGFAWPARRAERGRAVGLFLAVLGLLAFEAGVEESLLELTCAVLLALETRRLKGRREALLATIGAGGASLVLVTFAARQLVAAARSLL